MKHRRKKIKWDQRNFVELLLFRYAPYWPLFVIFSAMMIVVAWAYIKIATPVYKVTATLLIKDEKKGVENAQMMASLNILTSKKIVENEIEVIKSKTLMLKTVEILQLSAPIYEKDIFSDKLAYTSCPLAVEIRDIEKITEGEPVDFTYDATTHEVELEGHRHQLGEWLKTLRGEIKFTINQHVDEIKGANFYVRFVGARRIVDQLGSSLNVQPSNKLSTVINISLDDPVPQRGENILNTLIACYNEANADDNNNLAKSTLEFVEERITVAEKELDSLEKSIEYYKSTRGIVDLSEQGRVFLRNVGDNDQKLSDINMQLAVLRKLEDYVVKKGVSSKIVPANLSLQEAGLSKLVQKLYDSEVAYEALRKTTAENNPILLGLKNEIENLRPGIIENINNQKQSLLASKANVNSTNSRYASELETIPKKEKYLLEATRQQGIKNNLYTFLLQKREETILSSASTVADSRLVDAAESSIYPVSPKKLLVYSGALALAFLISIAWVAQKEILGRYTMFRSEVEASTTIPIAAEILDSGGRDIVVDAPLKNLILAEQFKQLSTAIGFYGKSSRKVLTVTSAIGGEGKSFISINCAISLANSGKKVLLIDLDLRNPRISRFFNISSLQGIGDYLGGEVGSEKVIRRTGTSNLSLIGAGINKSNPIELISRDGLLQCIEKFRLIFDYIVVDTPPILPVADAYLISLLGDATLFVIRHERTPKKILQILDTKTAGLKNTSIVFNAVKPRGFLTSSVDYGYGQAYGYCNVYGISNGG
ncbi:MAG: polysaccharide biosynthesis tyrosine autokinase [Chryseolinea sp.]